MSMSNKLIEKAQWLCIDCFCVCLVGVKLAVNKIDVASLLFDHNLRLTFKKEGKKGEKKGKE